MNRCRLCPSRKLPIEGHGPVPCSIMFIGEAPGKTEDRTRDVDGRGMPFHGDAGRELNEVYLPLAGLRRDQVYVTNTVQCIPDVAGGNPTPVLASCCASHHLPGEIATVEPDIIVTLGAVALHTLFPGQSGLDTCHGIPFEAHYSNVWSGTVFPMYHPAAGLRSGATMAHLVTDFTDLGNYLRGHRMEKQELGTYTDLDTPADVDEAFNLYPYQDSEALISMDTEVYSLISLRPYCLSFTTQPGVGFVIAHWHQPAVDRLYHHLSSAARLLMHNAPFDRPILEAMFQRTLPPRLHITDTMVMAYNLQSVPRGLKPLSLRYLGVEMTGFEDLVTPYWYDHLGVWAANASVVLAEAAATRPEKQTARKLTRLASELIDPSLRSESFDPWKRWMDWHEYDREFVWRAVEDYNLGKTEDEILSCSMPEMSISFAPWREVVPYAGADADVTMRLYPILRRMSTRFSGPLGSKRA